MKNFVGARLEKEIRERRYFWKMYKPVFLEEERTPRAKAHEDILSRFCWRSLAALCEFEDSREILQSSAKRRCKRGKVVHLLMSLMAIGKIGPLHTTP